jgi:hypothetical protein
MRAAQLPNALQSTSGVNPLSPRGPCSPPPRPFQPPHRVTWALIRSTLNACRPVPSSRWATASGTGGCAAASHWETASACAAWEATAAQ